VNLLLVHEVNDLLDDNKNDDEMLVDAVVQLEHFH
jgi:hypothetical protein